ncbi:MAG: hypothetical protein WCJ18_00470 [Planctomycetota bacterium]
MKQSDKSRAQRLLKLRREREAFRLRYMLSHPRTWLAVAVAIGGAAYTLFGNADLLMNRAIWLVIGIFIGRLVRDWIWLKDVVDAFPFMEKVLDWRVVEEIAADRAPDAVKG